MCLTLNWDVNKETVVDNDGLSGYKLVDTTEYLVLESSTDDLSTCYCARIRIKIRVSPVIENNMEKLSHGIFIAICTDH